MADEPDWWRGQEPPDSVPEDWGWDEEEWISGTHTGALPDPGPPESGLVARPFFRAHVADVDLRLDDVHLTVAWSQFDRCRFRQRTRPVLNAFGVAAQGSFGIRPAVYRGCSFTGVRFTLLGGFDLGRARFEGCTFTDCRWEGHFASDADLVGCVFSGRMNGCVWFGHGTDHNGTVRRNTIEDNDFTATRFTANVGWRDDFPSAAQSWPQDYVPLVDP